MFDIPIRRKRGYQVEIDHPGIPGADNRWFPSQGQARKSALVAARQLGLGYKLAHDPNPRIGLPHYHIINPQGRRVSGHFFYGRHLPRRLSRTKSRRARTRRLYELGGEFEEDRQVGAGPVLQHITHAGPYRLAYDRLTTLGVIEPLPGRNTRKFRGTAALQTALNKWAPYISKVMPPPNYILTGGLTVNKPGEHGKGNAIDVDGFWWSSTNKFLAKDAPTDWYRYLTIEATLRKVFGTVLNYDYNVAHHDHWHCDLGMPTRWRAVKSQAKFAQRALNEIWGENLQVDGRWGKLSQAAASRNGYNFSVAGGWDHFLDDIINQQSTPSTMPEAEQVQDMEDQFLGSIWGWFNNSRGFQLTPVENPGGGRITDKRDPAPGDLVTVTGVGGKRIQLHRLAAQAWQAMVRAAQADGVSSPLLLPTSGYRSSSHQAKLWQAALKRYGSPQEARKWVAPPGGSAHQSGRAIDFYLGGLNSSGNVAALRRTAVYRWLVQNAERF
ncbi:MAG: D-alanyl-D-alanine carboxypeptidase family protein, partial [Anaerolineae bacterium]|nr:D-alanyl-D-alanine carboxypeptidase family protein [Anaerolineae bacterium]